MKAILPTQAVSKAKNLDKEVIKRYHAIGLFNGVMGEFIDCRLYMSRSADGAGPVYCNIWVRGEPRIYEGQKYMGHDLHTSGHGTATGYGYHKSSQAVASAIKSAGVKLLNDEGKPVDIGGRGDSLIEDAIRAIALAAGAEQVLIVG